MTKNTLRIPKLEFDTSRESQANYLCFVASEIATRDHANRGFTVLPYLIPGNTKAIYFPDLNYPHKFWRLIKRYGKRDFSNSYPKDIYDIANSLLPHKNFPHLKINQYNIFWKEIAKLKIFNNIRLKKITVLLTDFGPGSSFYYKNSCLNLSFRVDRSPITLYRSIISGLTLAKYGKPGKSDEKWWQNRFYSEFVSKELLHAMNISNSFISPSPKDIINSKKYLQKLGLGKFKKIKEVNLNRFSPQEKSVLMVLLNKNMLTTDEIAQILWKENWEEKYSLWAITKLVQKIREKIKKLGGNPDQIGTIYGKGYCLNN